MIGRPAQRRLKLAAGLCLLPFALVIPRLVWLQLLNGAGFERIAERQNMMRVWYPPHRGDIVDRNGIRLAFTVTDTTGSSGGLGADHGVSRVYPYGTATAQVVGYLNRAGVGAAGIERTLEDELRGHPGWATKLRDGEGHTYLFSDRPGRPVTSGYTVQLTVDANLQDVAMTRLEDMAREMGARAASVVGLDPATGEVLVMCAWPTFDPDHAAGAPLDHVLNRAVTHPYEPGSTFKIVPALTALANHLVTPTTLIDCEGGRYQMGRRTIVDDHHMEILPFHSCFAQSSNIAFAKVGDMCGTRLYDTARALGLGSATGIRLPGESNGRVPNPENWSGYTAGSLGFGYEVLVTPLQMAVAYASVGNGGVRMRPYILRSISDADGRMVYENRPQAVARVADPGLCRLLKSFMREVVEDGTGKKADLSWVEVGGKTGTSKKLVDGTYASRQYYASFVGMAPLENPRIVLMVVVDDPKTSIYGGSAAAPIFREILDAYRRMPGAKLTPDYATVRAEDEPGAGNGGWWSVEQASADVVRDRAEAEGGVPDFLGLSLREAWRLCRETGIPAKVEGSGVVVKQSPPPGSQDKGDVTLICEPPGPQVLADPGS